MLGENPVTVVPLIQEESYRITLMKAHFELKPIFANREALRCFLENDMLRGGIERSGPPHLPREQLVVSPSQRFGPYEFCQQATMPFGERPLALRKQVVS